VLLRRQLGGGAAVLGGLEHRILVEAVHLDGTLFFFHDVQVRTCFALPCLAFAELSHRTRTLLGLCRLLLEGKRFRFGRRRLVEVVEGLLPLRSLGALEGVWVVELRAGF